MFHVETISKTMDAAMEPLPFPTKASIYQHRSPRSHKGMAEEVNITLEVETSKMLILENEPSEEKVKLAENETMKCEPVDNLVSSTLLLTTLVVMQVRKSEKNITFSVRFRSFQYWHLWHSGTITKSQFVNCFTWMTDPYRWDTENLIYSIRNRTKPITPSGSE